VCIYTRLLTGLKVLTRIPINILLIYTLNEVKVIGRLDNDGFLFFCTFEVPNQMDFDEIGYERYIIEGHPKLILSVSYSS
jgi:hypothetical protein